MNRSITFSNTPLNMKKIKLLKELLDNNENINQLKIHTYRNIKENKVKIKDSQKFTSIDELIKYIDEKEIEQLEEIEFNIYYKNKNEARLMYKKYDCVWELSYFNQDFNIDSLILNLKCIMRNDPLKLFRQYRGMIIAFFVGITFVFVLKHESAPDFSVFLFFIITWTIILGDAFFSKNVAYRENKFLTRNRDDIILSTIWYILGVITPYIISFLKNSLSK